MVRRTAAVITLGLILLLSLPSAAFACGGLIALRHQEVLRRATTLAAWHDGVEHYITGFEFAGAASAFGYIIPLPAVPKHITKGGNWTLERLEREAFPPPKFAGRVAEGVALSAASPVQILQHVVIDSLDIKVVKGGGADVAEWARKHSFDLTPDAASVLGSYKANLFALAKFDVKQARKQFIEGQGVVIDFEIPLAAPWIPLRILGLGKAAVEQIDAHLFLLTDSKPMLEPAPASIKGMRVVYDGWTSPDLITDLRSDRDSAWIPDTMWFTAIDMSTPARTVSYDLAGVSGIVPVQFPAPAAGETWAWPLVAAAIAAIVSGVAVRTAFRRAATG